MKLVFGTYLKPIKRYPVGNTDQWKFIRENFAEVDDSILLTRQEFNELRAKIAGDAFDAGMKFERYGFTRPDKQQYLLSLNSKEK